MFRERNNTKKVLEITLVEIILLALIFWGKYLDRILLLEKKNPNYWNNLSENKMNEYYHLAGDVNKIIPHEIHTNVNGMTVNLDSDCNLFVDGACEGEGDTLQLTSTFQLEDGVFFLETDGLSGESDINVYVLAVDFEGNAYYLTETKNMREFEADTNKYAWYSVNLYIPRNSQENEMHTNIVLRRSDLSAGDLNDGSKTIERFAIIPVSEDSFREIKHTDIKRIKNRYTYSEYDWISIVAGNTAIQFIGDNILYGKADTWGRVISENITDYDDFLKNR